MLKVVGGVIVRVHAQALGADGVRLRAEVLGRLRVLHGGADLVAHELGEVLVCDGVDHVVREAAEEFDEATLGPRCLVNAVALLVAHAQRAHGGGRVIHTASGFALSLAEAVTVGPVLVENGLGNGSVVRGDREAGRALEHGERLGLRRDDRDGLDGRRPGTDDRDALAGEVHALVRPATREVGGPLEAIGALNVYILGHRQRAGGHDVVLGRDGVARGGADRPALGLAVPLGGLHLGGELDVLAEVVALRDVLGVLEQFGLGRVLLGPLPVLLELGVERHRVLDALDVYACARVAVPEPGSAHICAGLKHLDGEAEGAKLVEQVHAGKARTHHHDVQFPLRSTVRHPKSPRSRSAHPVVDNRGILAQGPPLLTSRPQRTPVCGTGFSGGVRRRKPPGR